MTKVSKPRPSPSPRPGAARHHRGRLRSATLVAGFALLTLVAGRTPAQAMQMPMPSGSDDSAPAHSDAAHHDEGAVASAGTGTSHQWRHPDQVAGATLVRVVRSAHVFVAVHASHLKHFEFDVQDGPSTTMGFMVNPRGAVLTNSAALTVSDAQNDRYAVWAVNQGVKRMGFGLSPGGDFARRQITSMPKDQQITLDDMKMRLQNCYGWRTSLHCAVLIQPKITILPFTTSADDKGYSAVTVWDDAQVAVLTTSDTSTPLTAQLADGKAGSEYWALTGASAKGGSPTGTLTKDAQKPLSDADLKKLWQDHGMAGAGAPLISRTGDVIGMLGLKGDGLEVIPASHLNGDSQDAVITMGSGPLDTQFRDGMKYFESSQFRAAHSILGPVVKASGNELIAATLDAEAKSKQDTAADLTDAANNHMDMSGTSGSSRTWLWAVAGIVLLIVAGAFVLYWRRRTAGDGADHPATAQPALPPAVDGLSVHHAPDGSARAGTHGAGLNGETVTERIGEQREARSSKERPGVAPAGAARPTTMLAPPRASDLTPGQKASAPPAAGGSFCPKCGSQLSPGDRFCFSCGTPAR